jgi:hypothetical protein
MKHIENEKVVSRHVRRQNEYLDPHPFLSKHVLEKFAQYIGTLADDLTYTYSYSLTTLVRYLYKGMQNGVVLVFL